MRSDIALDQSAAAAFGPPPEKAPPPAKSQKKKSTEQRSVLDQKIIDEYWNRRATSDIEWAKSLAGGKLNKTVAPQALAPAPMPVAPPLESLVDRVEALLSTTLSPVTEQVINESCVDSTEEIVDNLIASTVQNLGSLVQDSINRCILAGQHAFSNKSLTEIEASAKELAGLLTMQQRFDQAKQFLSEQGSQALEPAQNSDIPAIPGLDDMVKYIGLRSASNDKVIVEATLKRDYELVGSLARCGAKLSRLHSVLLWMAPHNENLDFTP